MQLIRKRRRKGETNEAYESEDSRMGTPVESTPVEVTVIRDEWKLHTEDRESIRT